MPTLIVKQTNWNKLQPSGNIEQCWYHVFTTTADWSMVINQKPLTNKQKTAKKCILYVGITMVRFLHLTTRCTSTMAAGKPLRGLFHNCRSTPTPFLLPHCPTKGPAHHWLATTQANTTSSPLITYLYSQALQVPPPKRVPLCQQPHSAPFLMTPPGRPPFAKCACCGSW